MLDFECCVIRSSNSGDRSLSTSLPSSRQSYKFLKNLQHCGSITRPFPVILVRFIFALSRARHTLHNKSCISQDLSLGFSSQLHSKEVRGWHSNFVHHSCYARCCAGAESQGRSTLVIPAVAGRSHSLHSWNSGCDERSNFLEAHGRCRVNCKLVTVSTICAESSPYCL